MTGARLKLRTYDRIAQLDGAVWDACAGTDNPFISHAFLSALEDSGSASAPTGWQPHHLAFENDAGSVVAVVPAYVKSHSYGEYVFDQGWADGYQRAGGKYYPKLQCAVPFSPVTGARLLVRPDAGVHVADIGDGVRQMLEHTGMSSAHITFCDQNLWETLGQNGWLQRLGLQFHWYNNGYANFDDFLAALSSRHRKTIRRERRDANAAGLNFLTLRGDDIKPQHWDAFYAFYQATVDRKWGAAYLTREFFTLLSERLGDKIVLMMAEHADCPVAGALNLMGADTLYGRNWGCVGEWPFLHFELCYYRAIDFALAHNLKRVEAGAQGEHKILRGYLPSYTYSLHAMAEPRFAAAVESFLDVERRHIRQEHENLAVLSPFRKDDHQPVRDGG